MSTRTPINAALALLVAALGAWLFFKPAPETPVALAVLNFDPAAATRIRLERTGLPTLELTRKQDAWRLDAPVTARADADKVAQLLETARARSATTLPAEQLGRYELAPPAATLTVDDHAIAFGMLNPVTSQQYVLAGGSVHTISPKYYAMLPLAAGDLMSRALLAPGETLTGIVLPGLSARQGSSGWALDAPAAGLSADEVNVWADRWRHAVAAAAAALETPADPPANAALTLEDGRRVELAVEQTPKDVFITRLDERVRYRFAPDAGAALLSGPNAAP
jgi:hypothetical protein